MNQLQATLQQMEQTPLPLAYVGLIVGMLWNLMSCLAGYAILRVMLVVYGVHLGAFLGAILAYWAVGLRHAGAQPSGMDVFVACTALAVVMAIASWHLYRVTTAVLALISILAIGLPIFGWPPPVLYWIVAGAIGIVVAALLVLYTRPLVIVFTGLLGGIGAVFAGASVIAEGPDRLAAMLADTSHHSGLTLLLICLAMALAAAGIMVQTKTLNWPERAAPAGKKEEPEKKTPAKDAARGKPVKAG
jgi:hypothetical protein